MPQQQEKEPTLAEGVRKSLGLADFLGRPAELLTKSWGGEGYRRHGPATLLSIGVPLLACQGEWAGAGVAASGALFLLLLGRKAAARLARRPGKSSVDVGTTAGFSGHHPTVELIYGFAVAGALHHFELYPLASLMVISASCSAVGLKALLAKQEMEVVIARDQMAKGEYFGRRLEE